MSEETPPKRLNLDSFFDTHLMYGYLMASLYKNEELTVRQALEAFYFNFGLRMHDSDMARASEMFRVFLTTETGRRFAGDLFDNVKP